MIKGVEFAMLTTAGDDGTPRSRPMRALDAEFDGDLYFFTGADSPKVGEIERDRHVCVSYAAPKDGRYVSMSGLARLLRDPARMKELCSPGLKERLPGGSKTRSWRCSGSASRRPSTGKGRRVCSCIWRE